MTNNLGDFLNYVDGEWVEAADGTWIDITSPSNTEVIARAPRSKSADVSSAVDAAEKAFGGWRDTAPRERGRSLQLIADALEPHSERIARLISEENGNALRTQSRGEVNFAVETFRYFGSVASELKGETVPLKSTVLDYSRREPVGVVGAIVPWNAPVQLAVMKIASALAAGNSLVLKAAEDAPIAVLEIVKICEEFIPSGVLNVIVGYGSEAGEALTQHPSIKKLSFTGSTEVGRRVMSEAAKRITPVSLELGGKNPQIVYPDADEEWVAKGVVTGMRFVRQGQSCTAGSRLFVHKSIMESFVEKVVSELRLLKVGDPLDESSDIGAIVNKKQFDRVSQFISEGLEREGVSAAIGGAPPESGPLSQGYYVEPTVLVGVENSWRVAQEEIFGPVLVVIPWEEEDEVIDMANDTHYGLSAFIWTHDLGRALRAAHSIDAGWIQVNQGGGQVLGQSYGGYKQSGIGREFSLEGMLESFTERKHVSIDTSH